MAESSAVPVLVDPAVSKGKLAAEVAAWRSNEDLYRRRGLVLARHDELEVDLLVLAPSAPLPLAAAGVYLRFDNYDLWPPSLTFCNPYTGEPLPPGAMPVAMAVDVRENPPRPLVPGLHPDSGQAFLCLPGIREYHVHDEHNGDHWLRYRGAAGVGTLDHIATTLHQRVGATARLALRTTVVLQPGGPEVGFEMQMMVQRMAAPANAPGNAAQLGVPAAEVELRGK